MAVLPSFTDRASKINYIIRGEEVGKQEVSSIINLFVKYMDENNPSDFEKFALTEEFKVMRDLCKVAFGEYGLLSKKIDTENKKEVDSIKQYFSSGSLVASNLIDIKRTKAIFLEGNVKVRQPRLIAIKEQLEEEESRSKICYPKFIEALDDAVFSSRIGLIKSLLEYGMKTAMLKQVDDLGLLKKCIALFCSRTSDSEENPEALSNHYFSFSNYNQEFLKELANSTKFPEEIKEIKEFKEAQEAYKKADKYVQGELEGIMSGDKGSGEPPVKKPKLS